MNHGKGLIRCVRSKLSEFRIFFKVARNFARGEALLVPRMRIVNSLEGLSAPEREDYIVDSLAHELGISIKEAKTLVRCLVGSAAE